MTGVELTRKVKMHILHQNTEPERTEEVQVTTLIPPGWSMLLMENEKVNQLEMEELRIRNPLRLTNGRGEKIKIIFDPDELPIDREREYP